MILDPITQAGLAISLVSWSYRLSAVNPLTMFNLCDRNNNIMMTDTTACTYDTFFTVCCQVFFCVCIHHFFTNRQIACETLARSSLTRPQRSKQIVLDSRGAAQRKNGSKFGRAAGGGAEPIHCEIKVQGINRGEMDGMDKSLRDGYTLI